MVVLKNRCMCFSDCPDIAIVVCEWLGLPLLLERGLRSGPARYGKETVDSVRKHLDTRSVRFTDAVPKSVSSAATEAN